MQLIVAFTALLACVVASPISDDFKTAFTSMIKETEIDAGIGKAVKALVSSKLVSGLGKEQEDKLTALFIQALSKTDFKDMLDFLLNDEVFSHVFEQLSQKIEKMIAMIMEDQALNDDEILMWTYEKVMQRLSTYRKKKHTALESAIIARSLFIDIASYYKIKKEAYQKTVKILASHQLLLEPLELVESLVDSLDLLIADVRGSLNFWIYKLAMKLVLFYTPINPNYIGL